MKNLQRLFFVPFFVCPLFVFATQDTLSKKRINVSVSGGLIIPQKKESMFYSTQSWPNGIFHASPEHPLNGIETNKNSWSIAANIDVKIYKGLYFQSGINCTVFYAQSYFTGDSLCTYKNTWCNAWKYNGTKTAISMPLVLSYRFNKWVFLSAGILINPYTVDVGYETYYNKNNSIFTQKNVTTSGGITKCANVQVRVLKQLYVNFGISDATFEKNGLYYNLGVRFFVF